MSASSTAQSTTVHRRAPTPDAATAAGAVIALGCTVVGNYVATPWKSGPGTWGVDFGGNGGWATLAVLAAFATVALILVGLTTARARAVPPENTARRALVVAVLGAAAILVFWTGMAPVLAGGAAGLAVDARRRLGRLSGSAAGALALATLTIASAIYLAFTG
jgi:hypothetical protein